MLRIEDTDLKRNTPTAMRQVMDDLRWLGINWDEGPEVGGPNGPYLQSQRRDIYDKYVRQLLDGGKAYYCFESTDELEAMREEAEAQKKGFVYQRPAQLPTEQDAERARVEGKPVAVRFAMPQDKQLVVEDLVRGRVTFAAAEIGDFIIQKSDGFPTYNFACVVDDYLMGITHVIRGQEHLMNTPGQQALWRAMFGDAPLPKYVHMSVTVSESGGKLSKREQPEKVRKVILPQATKTFVETISANSAVNLPGLTLPALTVPQVMEFIEGKSVPDMPYIKQIAKGLNVALPEINLVDFRDSGYLPETMVNFLALLGWNPGDGREVMSVGELIESFDLSRLTKSNSLFDRRKLLAFNTEHIRMLPKDKLLWHLRGYLKVIDSPVMRADDDMLLRIIALCEGARTLADIERKSRFLFLADDEIEYDENAVNKVLLKDGGAEILRIERERLAAMDEFDVKNVEAALHSLAEERQIGLGKVAQPLRVALCGSTISISIFDAVEILGKEKVLVRLDRTLKAFGGS